MKEPLITVGILSASEISFSFPTPFLSSDGMYALGREKVILREGKIMWRNKTYDQLLFSPRPTDENAFFELEDVTIGIDFHWERKESQQFKGALQLIVEGEKLTAINVVPIETYLTSVISSEMSASASPALLQAHAIISRSWLLNKIKERKEKGSQFAQKGQSPIETESMRIQWYDHESHLHFDVCADDHCQRYQGITRASTPKAAEAVKATRGEVLTYQGVICDARFSKCCGGAMEVFPSCWEDCDHPYLVGKRDAESPHTFPNLREETQAEQWIRTTPAAFCHTTDTAILKQVLNNYDQETPDFYRWTISYTQEELSRLIEQRSGIQFGKILALTPILRGSSGRIIQLKITGSLRTLIIGKELEIRRTLSSSHLYSSAFVVDTEGKGDVPERFILTGAGWGHGVGLCQIGAAVMGEKGYSYSEILTHYYPESHIEKLYL